MDPRRRPHEDTDRRLQNAPVMVLSPSIQADVRRAATIEWQAARRIAVTPPRGAQTDSRPRGRPPFGKTLSSRSIPVATCSVVCAPPVSGVASGNFCWMSARSAATEVDIERNGEEVQSQSGE